MKTNKEFEIVEIAGEYMAVPVGSLSKDFHGVVALTEASAFLLRHMDAKNKGELIQLLLDEYDIDKDTIERDLDAVIQKMLDIGLIEA